MKTTDSTNSRSLRPATVALGYAGLAPFIGAVLAIALGGPEPRDTAARALVAYGAVILSFVGAVHWGLLLRTEPDGNDLRTALASVLPALVAWVALLLPVQHALAVLVVGFGAFWLYEHRIAGTSFLPADYLSLRRSLTLAVCALLALGLIALR